MLRFPTGILLGLIHCPLALASGAQEPSPQPEGEILSALRSLDDHLMGKTLLSEAEFAGWKELLDERKAGFGDQPDAKLISAALELVADYEAIEGPMFIGEATNSGFQRKNMKVDLHSAVLVVMQAIVDHFYTSETLMGHEALLGSFSFKSADYFPGAVEPPSDPERVHAVVISASCLKTFGHPVINDSKPARKPTGTYLVPGTVATIWVPESMVGMGYEIRIGAHSWDMSSRPRIKRLDRCSIVYPINRPEMKVSSPLGGGIYIEVPDQADAGVVQIRIKNAVRSPYFSSKPFHQTSLAEWKAVERNHPAPWADFQSEKMLIQVPTSWIYKFDDPATLLKDWDHAMDAVSDLMGFPHVRSREALYLQADVIIRSGAYSPGYPQVNATYNPNKDYGGNHDHYFLTGPQRSPAWTLHEMGHAQLFQKLQGETEAVVNLLYVAAMNQKFGMSLDEAFYRSRRYDNDFMTLANTAITWMASENFRLEKPMVGAEMQYQLKGHAKYVEIARLFGWEVLNRYWYSINEDYEAGIKLKGSRNNGNTNNLILRMSRSAGVDVTPLIHFWGRHPDDVVAMKASITAASLPPSTKIYDLLVQYQDSIPADNEGFRAFAASWWEKQPSSKGHMTEKYHASLWDSWNETYASEIRRNMQKIIDLYFPDGRP